MKKALYIFLLIFFALYYHSIATAQTMNDYCQWPPFLTQPVQPNVLLLIDTSGSMGWKAYSYGDTDSNGDGILDHYNPNVTYEGYFDPEKYYSLDANGVYVETTPTGQPCVKTCVKYQCANKNLGDCIKPSAQCGDTKWMCCSQWQQSGDCNVNTGNYLNYKYMSRVDLLRWAMTGGRPSSCNNSIQTCDPELYGQPNANLTCDATGCILLSSDGTTLVKARWDRITGSSGGLLFQLKNLGLKPRMGAMFFDSTGVNRTVFIGDFTASASFDGVNPYKNTITAINSEQPGGATPIGPAMWDAYNYLAQLTPKFGGPQPQTGSGNEWKNPMYQCFDDNNDGNCQGNEFKLVPCAKNFIILLTDGQWNRGGDPPPSSTSKCSIDEGVTSYDGGSGEQYSADPVVPAYWLHKKGFTNAPTGLNTYVEAIYTVGMWLGGTGEVSLKNVAMYGSFDRSLAWPGGTSDYPKNYCGPVDDCCTGSNCGRGSSCTALPASHPSWDKKDMDGNSTPDGIPDTFFKADDAVQIKNQMVKIILDILRRVSAGTAVSILASGEGQGANLLQAVFYPQRTLGVDNTDISWTGAMQNLWYYVDPLFKLSTIREDTVSDRKLNLVDDYITQIYFDQSSGQTLASRCQDTDGDGDCDSIKPTINFEDLKNLWEAGIKLFQKAPADRTIYTNYNGFVLFNTPLANDATFRSLLQAANLTEATNIIDYIRGTDITGSRGRTVTLNIGSTNVTKTWKLGDIVHSTPRIQSWVPLNDYYERYNDLSYKRFTNDLNDDDTPKTSKLYTDRGMVYVGANDGMLHAFYLGKLKLYPGTTSLKAELQDVSSKYDPGEEVWSFIPKNALPYLKYLMDLEYCHLYYIDASPYLFDASIGTDGCTTGNYWDCPKTTNTWRTILIGSMNLGGACRNTGSTCTDCVKTPVNNVGYSSYFALDISNQENPQLLWEFSSPDLGFSTSGPVVFRAGASDKNGRWFVMFASGPTGPIDTSAHNFMGRSDQNLKLFILDLKSGQLLSTIDTGITNAFGGSLLNSVVDLNDDYQDDIIYIPYSKWSSTTSSWTGGVGRFITKGIDATNPDFTNKWSKAIETSGPVTSAPVFLRSKNKHELWIYFGTGRYFYKMDDLAGRRRIYGIKEPCYLLTDTIDTQCTKTVGEGSLSDSTVSISSSIGDGWFIGLDCASTDTGCTYTAPTGYGAERVITTPLASPAGAVFFTTFSPTSDICGYGGSSYIWAVNYRTGGVAPSAALQGKALLQLSTGEIREIDLKTAFTERGPGGSGGGRRSVGFFGVPPQGQGLSAIVPADPIKRFIFIKEK